MMLPKNLIVFFALLLIAVFANLRLYAQETYPDSIASVSDYFNVLADADSTSFIHDFEYPFLTLLNEFQIEYYKSLQSIDAMKEYIGLYWNRENPNPLDAENWWLKSFIERQNYTKKYFSHDRPPYFDDRGGYYLKYGEPKSKYGRRGETRPERGGDPFGQEYVTENAIEMWSYEHIVNDFVIYFEKEMSTFEQVRYPGQLANKRASGKRLMWWNYLNKMFFYTSHLTGLYVDVQSDIDDGRLGFDAALIKGMSITQGREAIAKVNAPLSIEDPEPEERSLHFIDDVSQFRGPGGSTRIETSYLVPIEDIHGDVSSTSTDTLSIQYSELLRDIDYNPVIGSSSQRSFPLQSAAREGLDYAVNAITLIAPPLLGELTLQIKNNTTGHLGYSKNIVDIRSFQRTELMISDIQLFKEVTTTDQRIVLPSSVKGGFYAAPYPFPEIHKSEPVLLYFEVYNIVDDGSSKEYTLEISVDWDESREKLVSKFFDFLTRRNKYSIGRTDTRITDSNTIKEAILFDMSSLRNGPYTLSVTVSDVSDQNKVTSSKKIMIDN